MAACSELCASPRSAKAQELEARCATPIPAIHEKRAQSRSGGKCTEMESDVDTLVRFAPAFNWVTGVGNTAAHGRPQPPGGMFVRVRERL